MNTSSSQEVKQALWDVLEQLPAAQRRQVLDFARFLRQQGLITPRSLGEVEGGPAPEPKIQLRLVPVESLVGLTGLVSLGGDAVTDTEALYNGDGSPGDECRCGVGG
jgi:hypothetical protein